jgi:sigma-54 dependent transcriptional regulator, flagellar regulatory protein
MGEVPPSGPRAAGSASPISNRSSRVTADLIGASAPMRELREAIARIAPTDATVLITGPSGSGKENAARAVHAASQRANGPFEAVNCGAIPCDLAEAELFGAEAGAYTGAMRARTGRLEAANGGTLFLDEIGDLPLALQVKLLRALETRSIERLGGGRAIAVDFRLVAATNVDLEDAMEQGRFRSDLYWRLAVVPLEMPPLSARCEDIDALVAHFAGQLRQRVHLPADGLARLRQHDWPGNLRELRNLVERALALGERVLSADTVERMLQPRRRRIESWLEAPVAPSAARASTLAQDLCPISQSIPAVQLKALLAQAEVALITQALEASNGTIAESARLLGLKRTTLVEKLKRMGLKAANEAA